MAKMGGKTQAVCAALLAGSAALVPATARADTLREALLAAYNTNPALQAARAQQRATDETVPIERAAGLPSASASASESEFVKTSGNSFTAPGRAFQAGVDLSIPIYSAGAVKNAVRAAENRVEAGRAGLRGAESSVFSQTVAAYMDVIRAEAVVALNANQVEVLTVNLQATTDRFEIGDLTRTDIAQSQSRLSLAKSDLRAAQANLIAARENYINIVGKAPVDLQPPPPLAGLPSSVDDAVAIALESNPDFIGAQERAKASEYDIATASAVRMPKVSLYSNGNYTNYFNTLGGQSTAAFRQSDSTATVGVRLTMPLFQGGRAGALERQAQARSAVAMEQAVQAERGVIAQTRSAFASWEASVEIIRSSEEAIRAAELSLEGVRAENSIGNRTILDVLNAEQELLRARSALVTARRNSYVAGFTLLASMGKAEARDLALDSEGALYDPMVNYDRAKRTFWEWGSAPNPVSVSTRTVDIPAQNVEEITSAASTKRK